MVLPFRILVILSSLKNPQIEAKSIKNRARVAKAPQMSVKCCSCKHHPFSKLFLKEIKFIRAKGRGDGISF